MCPLTAESSRWSAQEAAGSKENRKEIPTRPHQLLRSSSSGQEQREAGAVGRAAERLLLHHSDILRGVSALSRSLELLVPRHLQQSLRKVQICSITAVCQGTNNSRQKLTKESGVGLALYVALELTVDHTGSKLTELVSLCLPGAGHHHSQSGRRLKQSYRKQEIQSEI